MIQAPETLFTLANFRKLNKAHSQFEASFLMVKKSYVQKKTHPIISPTSEDVHHYTKKQGNFISIDHSDHICFQFSDK